MNKIYKLVFNNYKTLLIFPRKLLKLKRAPTKFGKSLKNEKFQHSKYRRVFRKFFNIRNYFAKFDQIS